MKPFFRFCYIIALKNWSVQRKVRILNYPETRCTVFIIETFWKQFRSKTSLSSWWEKEGRSFFRTLLPVFISADGWKDCAERSNGGSARDEGNAKRDRSDWKTRRKLLRRVRNWPKVCKSVEQEDRKSREVRELEDYFSRSETRNVAVLIVLLCLHPTVDQWHQSYINLMRSTIFVWFSFMPVRSLESSNTQIAQNVAAIMNHLAILSSKRSPNDEFLESWITY